MDTLDRLLSLCALADRVVARRARLQGSVAEGYQQALARQGALRAGPSIAPRIPSGMEEALCIAGELGRPTGALDLHYTHAMPSRLAEQLRGAAEPAARLFATRLHLSRMPRLRAALEALFALVADAGLDCRRALGAASPLALLAERPTLGDLYASAHFGRSMPMLYAHAGEPASLPRALSPEQWVDARYTGPLLHELAHLHPLDEALVPAPGNLHEALAAWLGSEAFPEQLFPRAPSGPGDPGGLDALPGGPWFAAVGAWLSRSLGPRDAIRAQAGALDLRDRLGAGCAEALRLYGWLAHLESSAPHLLATAFAPQRWWKLVDLHRDPQLAAEFHAAHTAPLLSGPPPQTGTRLQQQWDAALDAIPWSALPAWSEPPGPEDEKLARRACRALGVRTILRGASFRVERSEPPPFVDERERAAAAGGTAGSALPGGAGGLSAGPLSLELAAGLLRAGFPGPDAVGAPPEHPFPPALCGAWARSGAVWLRGTTESVPPPGRPAANR